MPLPIERNTLQISVKNFQEFPSSKMPISSGCRSMQGENLLSSMYTMKMPMNIHSALNREDGSPKMELVMRSGFG